MRIIYNKNENEKKRSQRYDVNRLRPRHEYKYTKYVYEHDDSCMY